MVWGHITPSLFLLCPYTRSSLFFRTTRCFYIPAFRDKKKAAYFIGSFAAAVLAVFLLLQYITSGEFIFHVVLAHMWTQFSFVKAISNVYAYIVQPFNLMILTAGMTVLFLGIVRKKSAWWKYIFACLCFFHQYRKIWRGYELFHRNDGCRMHIAGLHAW